MALYCISMLLSLTNTASEKISKYKTNTASEKISKYKTNTASEKISKHKSKFVTFKLPFGQPGNENFVAPM